MYFQKRLGLYYYNICYLYVAGFSTPYTITTVEPASEEDYYTPEHSHSSASGICLNHHNLIYLLYHMTIVVISSANVRGVYKGGV